MVLQQASSSMLTYSAQMSEDSHGRQHPEGTIMGVTRVRV